MNKTHFNKVISIPPATIDLTQFGQFIKKYFKKNGVIYLNAQHYSFQNQDELINILKTELNKSNRIRIDYEGNLNAFVRELIVDNTYWTSPKFIIKCDIKNSEIYKYEELLEDIKKFYNRNLILSLLYSKILVYFSIVYSFIYIILFDINQDGSSQYYFFNVLFGSYFWFTFSMFKSILRFVPPYRWINAFDPKITASK